MQHPTKDTTMDENMRIELYLWRKGYMTQQIDGVINVRDPVHASQPKKQYLVLTGYNLAKIKTIEQAVRFIAERN